MKKPQILVFLLVMMSSLSVAQTIAVVKLSSGTKTNLRGLSVVNDNVVWVSGSNGTIGRTTNAGKNWKWMTVKGFEKTDFRDIEAFDASTAIIMGVAEPAYMLKTNDGGETWKVVYENKQKGMFLDAMDFFSPAEGIVVGDPLDGNIFLAGTKDGGNTWQQLNPWEGKLKADSGEAFFAASGTNIRLFGHGQFFLVSGGRRSRLFTEKEAFDLPIIQGSETAGANSVSVYDNRGIFSTTKIVVVGGDFAADSSAGKNCFYSLNGGKTWNAPREGPHGYRSCVEYISQKYIVSCGLNGVDLSSNSGRNWQWISKEAYNTCRLARLTNAVYFVGPMGKVGKLALK